MRSGYRQTLASARSTSSTLLTYIMAIVSSPAIVSRLSMTGRLLTRCGSERPDSWKDNSNGQKWKSNNNKSRDANTYSDDRDVEDPYVDLSQRYYMPNVSYGERYWRQELHWLRRKCQTEALQAGDVRVVRVCQTPCPRGATIYHSSVSAGYHLPQGQEVQ